MNWDLISISSVIVASGSTSLPLECSTTTGITGAADDIVTICTDPASSHSVAGTQDAKNSLPDFSLVTSYPVQGGCTFDSVVNPTWYMRGMQFKTNEFPADDPKSATLSSFTCGLTGPGFADFFFYANDILSGSGVDTVYNCNSYYDGKPVEDHWNCTYSFEPFDKVITLNKVWECSDKDAAHPDTYISCYWHDSQAVLQPGLPYDVPTVTVSLTKVDPLRIESVRKNGNWTLDGEGGMP